MTDAPPRAELLLDRDVPEDLGRELVAAFDRLGAPPVRVRRTLVHRGAADIPWIVLASLPLQAFLSGLGAEAVKDAYAAFKGVVRRTARPASATDGGARPLVLQDPAGGLSIVLEPDLPAEAYESLVALDLAKFTVGPLHYDRAQGRWRSVLDEAAG
ncbi:hypothetical protein DMA15_29340 [Streptomyces sp. WAC 01529]|uniref:hypothetical protein n=1 Tax=Streptomyces sp. WAC 01529 TaxID=2203205 RepID=UPI000F6B5B2A|nr:hypothetical protein [Streptomyces sp. WAC 01529]AZM56193.1 hypothetical protein DMA15_29340 [Streptomyces sp. WAC 01529]